MNWSGSVCLVTGASSGIGRAVAHALARRGATVIVSARRESRLEQLIEELDSDRHWYVVCDVTDLESVKAMAAAVAQRTDRLDLLVNNAGRPGAGLIAESTPEEVDNVVKTNLTGAIWCTQLLHDLMDAGPRTRRLPAVVNVASMAGRIPLPGAATYAATKFGMVGFSEALWAEMRNRDIGVTVVNPGLVHTEGFPMDEVLATPLLRRMVMSPERIAEALCDGVERGRAEVRVQQWWTPIYYLLFALGPYRRRLLRLFLRLVNKSVTT
ncbi:MAG: SDR family oxidoreductase, partial [Actinomycetota bacterium]